MTHVAYMGRACDCYIRMARHCSANVRLASPTPAYSQSRRKQHDLCLLPFEQTKRGWCSRSISPLVHDLLWPTGWEERQRGEALRETFACQAKVIQLTLLTAIAAPPGFVTVGLAYVEFKIKTLFWGMLPLLVYEPKTGVGRSLV